MAMAREGGGGVELVENKSKQAMRNLVVTFLSIFPELHTRPFLCLQWDTKQA